MHIVIIPGFTDYPEGKCFLKLTETLVKHGHNVIKVNWPHFPNDLSKYCITDTLEYSSHLLDAIKNKDLVILGFSMGGIIATILAAKYNVAKLGLIVSPYQAGSEDDLAGKYAEWKKTGVREIETSTFGKLLIPFSFIEDAKKYNALDYISQCKSSKLFVVGEEDTNVPLVATKKLYEKANNPKQWHQISGMKHRYQHQPDKLEIVNQLILEFIEKVNF